MKHKPIWDYETGAPLPSKMSHATNTNAVKKATLDLIDAVEKYVRQECSRSTLLAMKDNLKKLLEK